MVEYTFASATITGLIIADGGVAPPTDWNGSYGHVSLAQPKDYTEDLGKICVNAANHFDLEATMQWAIYCGHNNPQAADAVSLTDENLNGIVPVLAEHISRYRLYLMFSKTGLANAALMTYRQNDIIDLAEVIKKRLTTVAANDQDDVTEAIIDRLAAAAKALYGEMTGSEEKEAYLAHYGRMVCLSMVANAIHRDQNDDHSWFTKEMSNPRSPTSKACGVAGRDKIEFQKYMKSRGHDTNHHMATPFIDAYAKVLTGADSAIITTAEPEDRYCGELVADKDLKELLYLGLAAQGRYPPGMLGKAAALNSCSLFKIMINDIGSKIKLEGHAQIVENATVLRSQIEGIDCKHHVLLELTAALGPAISTTWGYCLEAGLVKKEDYQSVDNHAKRHDALMGSGKGLAKVVKRVTPHREAVQGTVVSALIDISEALAKAATVKIGGANPNATLSTTVAGNKVDSKDIKAMVSTQKSGDVFYDAEF